jgi:3-hydroxyacyl-CoA dehydrogenase
MNPDSIAFDQTCSPAIILVGVGVVGKAILRAHTDAGLSVCLVDQDQDALVAASTSLTLDPDQWEISDVFTHPCGLPCVSLVHREQIAAQDPIPLLIESIPERLDLKRTFFSEIENLVHPQTVLCSNTSTLRIGDLAQQLHRPEQFCGMHFFMPVESRDAVELIEGSLTDSRSLSRAMQHIERLSKSPLVVRDSPGFIVNRLLSPYLNEALTLLCQGVEAKDLQNAAIEYGMPISPLELIDTIGARTIFDAGRVYWQAYPGRIDPSPLLAGLIKSKRMGKHVKAGLFAYDDAGNRSDGLADAALALVDRYRRNDDLHFSRVDLVDRLAVPMWIEAASAVADGTVTDVKQFDLAVRGGLGYCGDRSWMGFFDGLGGKRILAAADRWSSQTKAIQIQPDLRNALLKLSPSSAVGGCG